MPPDHSSPLTFKAVPAATAAARTGADNYYQSYNILVHPNRYYTYRYIPKYTSRCFHILGIIFTAFNVESTCVDDVCEV